MAAEENGLGKGFLENPDVVSWWAEWVLVGESRT